MPAVFPPEQLLFSSCAVAPLGVYNEAFAGDQPRAAWQQFFEAASQIPAAELAHRSDQAQQLLHENGVTFNVFYDGMQSQRPWQLDLIPYFVAADEWRALEAGLRQRTRLLDQIIRDCHGDRICIRDGSLPPEVLFANPGFRRMFVGLRPWGPAIVHAAAELARHPDGTWRVMADRAESPVGAAFALENRIVTTRTLPAALNDPPVQRLAPFFIRFQETLRKLAGHLAENPRIVLLSPGAKYPYYFEDVYLARYLGYTLVEGADLAVRDHRVYLKTLAGLIPVDVILSRAIERGIDPLELGGGEPHGIPGLLRVVREGKVVVVNTPGCGLIESPIFMAFLGPLCRRFLGEDLLLLSIPTWWCGDPSQWDYVQSRFEDLVIKPAFQASGGDEYLPRNLSAHERQQLIERISVRPHEYVAQELIARSAVPVFRNGEVGVGHVALRAFLVADGDDYSVMPGGLARFADNAGPMQLSVAAGAGSKDVRVLADAPVAPVTLLTAEDTAVPLRRTSAIFPSRVADDLFWFGTFLDRADFLSRLLRSVVERLTAESSSDFPELPLLIRALADQGQIEPGFAIDSLSSPLPEFASVLPKMVANGEDVKGLAAAVSELYRLASLERLWISTDTYRKVRETAEAFGASVNTASDGLVDLLEALNKL
ncbi:MAG: circularly permuted type 2 ATP-grasp protein, partial [Planctomycetia bacterium]|nr:circularly permuted type 2 ATP-grasp protein [Planctomycetia bacterium]